MTETWEHTAFAPDGNHGGGQNEPEGQSTRPPEPLLGGKDPIVNPIGTADERIFVDDRAKAPATKVPGAMKVSILE